MEGEKGQKQHLSRRSHGQFGISNHLARADSSKVLLQRSQWKTANVASSILSLRAEVKKLSDNTLQCVISAYSKDQNLSAYSFMIPLNQLDHNEQIVLQTSTLTEEDILSRKKHDLVHLMPQSWSLSRQRTFIQSFENLCIKQFYQIRIRLIDSFQKLTSLSDQFNLRLERTAERIKTLKQTLLQGQFSQAYIALQDRLISRIQFPDETSTIEENQQKAKNCLSRSTTPGNRESLINHQKKGRTHVDFSSGNWPDPTQRLCQQCHVIKLDNEILQAENEELQTRNKDLKLELGNSKLMQFSYAQFDQTGEAGKSQLSPEMDRESFPSIPSHEEIEESLNAPASLSQINRQITRTWSQQGLCVRRIRHHRQVNKSRLSVGGNHSYRASAYRYQLAMQQDALNQQLKINNELLEQGLKGSFIPFSNVSPQIIGPQDIKTKIEEIPILKNYLSNLEQIKGSLDARIQRMTDEISDLKTKGDRDQENIMELTMKNQKLIADYRVQQLKLDELQNELNAWRAHGIHFQIGRRSQLERLSSVIQWQNVSLMQFQEAIQQYNKEQMADKQEIQRLNAQIKAFENKKDIIQSLSYNLEKQETLVKGLRSSQEKSINLWMDIYYGKLAKDLQNNLLATLAKNNDVSFTLLALTPVNKHNVKASEENKSPSSHVLCKDGFEHTSENDKGSINTNETNISDLLKLLRKAALTGLHFESELHQIKIAHESRLSTLLGILHQYTSSRLLSPSETPIMGVSTIHAEPQNTPVYVAGIEQALQQTIQAYTIQRDACEQLSQEKQRLLLLLKDQLRINKQILIENQKNESPPPLSVETFEAQASDSLERSLTALQESESKWQGLQEFLDQSVQSVQQFHAGLQELQRKINDLNKQLLDSQTQARKQEHIQRLVTEQQEEALKWKTQYLQLAELQNNMEGQLPDVKEWMARLSESLSMQSIQQTIKVQEQQSKIFDLESQVSELTTALKSSIKAQTNEKLNVQPSRVPRRSMEPIVTWSFSVKRSDRSKTIKDQPYDPAVKQRKRLTDLKAVGPVAKDYIQALAAAQQQKEKEQQALTSSNLPEQVRQEQASIADIVPQTTAKEDKDDLIALAEQSQIEDKNQQDIIMSQEEALSESLINQDQSVEFLRHRSASEVPSYTTNTEQWQYRLRSRARSTGDDERLYNNESQDILNNQNDKLQTSINSKNNLDEDDDFQEAYQAARILMAHSEKQLRTEGTDQSLRSPSVFAKIQSGLHIPQYLRNESPGQNSDQGDDTMSVSSINPAAEPSNYALSLAAMKRPTFLGMSHRSPQKGPKTKSLHGPDQGTQCDSWDFNIVIIDGEEWKAFARTVLSAIQNPEENSVTDPYCMQHPASILTEALQQLQRSTSKHSIDLLQEKPQARQCIKREANEHNECQIQTCRQIFQSINRSRHQLSYYQLQQIQIFKEAADEPLTRSTQQRITFHCSNNDFTSDNTDLARSSIRKPTAATSDVQKKVSWPQEAALFTYDSTEQVSDKQEYQEPQEKDTPVFNQVTENVENSIEQGDNSNELLRQMCLSYRNKEIRKSPFSTARWRLPMMSIQRQKYQSIRLRRLQQMINRQTTPEKPQDPAMVTNTSKEALLTQNTTILQRLIKATTVNPFLRSASQTLPKEEDNQRQKQQTQSAGQFDAFEPQEIVSQPSYNIETSPTIEQQSLQHLNQDSYNQSSEIETWKTLPMSQRQTQPPQRVILPSPVQEPQSIGIIGTIDSRVKPSEAAKLPNNSRNSVSGTHNHQQQSPWLSTQVQSISRPTQKIQEGLFRNTLNPPVLHHRVQERDTKTQSTSGYGLAQSLLREIRELRSTLSEGNPSRRIISDRCSVLQNQLDDLQAQCSELQYFARDNQVWPRVSRSGRYNQEERESRVGSRNENSQNYYRPERSRSHDVSDDPRLRSSDPYHHVPQFSSQNFSGQYRPMIESVRPEQESMPYHSQNSRFLNRSNDASSRSSRQPLNESEWRRFDDRILSDAMALRERPERRDPYNERTVPWNH